MKPLSIAVGSSKLIALSVACQLDTGPRISGRLGKAGSARCGTIYGTREREMVVAITASEARRALFPLIERVNDDRAPIEITSKRGNAVLMSADDYAAWQETAYLFRSPANARRLLDAAEAAERGETAEHPLDRA